MRNKVYNIDSKASISITKNIRSLLTKAPVDMEKLEQDVTEILVKYPTLQVLDLNWWNYSNNRPNNLGKYAPLIAKTIVKQLPNLEELDLSRNDLMEHGPATMAEIAKLSNLKVLHFSDHRLGEYTAATMAEIAKLPNLQILYLSGNRGRDKEYGSAAAQALAKAPSLKKLSLFDNELGRYTIRVAEILAKSPTLQYLDLGCNNLGDEYTPAVIDALTEESCNLVELTLCRDDIKICLQKIEDIKDRIPTLQIRLYCN